MKDYFEREFADAAGETQLQIMYPGDVLHGCELEPASPYRARLRDGELTHLIDEQYEDEIARKTNPDLLSAEAAQELAEDLRKQISMRAAALGGAQFDRLKFCVSVSDVGERRAFNVRFEKGEARVERDSQPDDGCAIVITAPSRVLRYAMKYEFGGDAIGIGYGADFQLSARDLVAHNLDQVCYQLLTRVPTRKAYLRENPRRVAGYLVRQSPLRTWRSYRKSGTKVGAANYDRSIWLLRDAEELRRMFSLPETSEPPAVAGAREPARYRRRF